MFFLDTLIQKIFFQMMKINNFRGDITDVSAKTESLAAKSSSVCATRFKLGTSSVMMILQTKPASSVRLINLKNNANLRRVLDLLWIHARYYSQIAGTQISTTCMYGSCRCTLHIRVRVMSVTPPYLLIQFFQSRGQTIPYHCQLHNVLQKTCITHMVRDFFTCQTCKLYSNIRCFDI